MSYVFRAVVVAILCAVGGLLSLSVSAQELGRRFSLDEFKSIVGSAKAVVVAQAMAQPASQGAEGATGAGLAWQVPFRVVRVVRGECKEETIQVHLASPFADLGMARHDVSGVEFVLPLEPLEKLGEGHFGLIRSAGFATNTAEAAKMLELAEGKAPAAAVEPAATGPEAAPPAAGGSLRVRITPVNPPFQVGKPALVRVTIENAGAEAIMYDATPLEIRDGGLYLSGRGTIKVIDGRGNPAPAKDTLHVGEATQMPLVIRGERDYEKELDLGRYFDLSAPGNYMVRLQLDGPEAGDLLQSNATSVQVIAAAAEPRPAAQPADEPQGPLAVRVPSPEAYRPGEPANGLSLLLKPVKAEYAVGEPILMEIRVINVGDVPVTLDARLERTLLVSVQEQAGSPAVRQIFQRPAEDEPAAPGAFYPYAYLRRLGFWGKVVNVNSWYGRDASSLVEGGNDKSQQASYERDGMTLFSFDEPGTYKVQATYSIKPRGGEGPKVWQGKTVSNPVFIQVVKPDTRMPVAPSP